ncbi:sulfurtransferase TusA [Candidatus Endobugula sertula]|uniref:Sulfur carrier protein TusA n=1 Tax=Candidatus Endobugula sertula TaxID=62101 RepID=A0A1D2QNE5_9GAMM|nr:sulfurtransferase TusA [Candidatus Endobugula sertula]
MTHNIDLILDTSGLFCPEPVMLLHKNVRAVNVGDVIQVIATDPSTMRDIPKFCHFLGHELLEQQEKGDGYYYVIRKAE